MNTVIIQPTAANKDYTLLAAWENYQLGWQMHSAGRDVTECRNIQQRRGWQSAFEAKHNGGNR